MLFALKALRSPAPYKRAFALFASLAAEVELFLVTAAASSQISTKLAPTLPLRRPCAADLKLKIALKSWSLVFTAATANLEFLGILDLFYKEF